MSLQSKISTFINRSQTKVRELSKKWMLAFDREGYQSKDSEILMLKITETRGFIRLLLTTDRGGMTNKEISSTIDFFTSWLELHKVSFVVYPQLQVVINDTQITVPGGTYALQQDLLNEIQARINGDNSLSSRVAILEGFDPNSIFPEGFWDNLNGSNAVVFNDDTRLHTHANKSTLDEITAGLLANLQALAAHYASIGEPNGIHVSSTDRTNWNAKVSQSQLANLSTVYAPISHVQAGANKHTISQITGLNDIINQMIQDIADMAGQDGREVELQAVDGVISWRYVGDINWIELGDFTGPQGPDGDPFTIDYRGLSSERLSSAFNEWEDGQTFLETDTGYLYFRYPAGGPATSALGWRDALKFVGDNGWSPVLSIYEVSAEKAVFEIIDWIGGSGSKPTFDPGSNPPDPIRWFIGPAGPTLSLTTAVNVRGPAAPGLNGKPIVDCGPVTITGGEIPVSSLAGTGPGGMIEQGNEFTVTDPAVIAAWAADTGEVYQGTILRAKVDNPGNSEANWKPFY